MPQPLVVSFLPEVRLAEFAEDRATLERPPLRIPLTGLSPGLSTALQVLASGGATEDALSDLVLEQDGHTGLAPLYFLLQRFAASGLLCHLLALNHPSKGPRIPLATLAPMGATIDAAGTDLTARTKVRLSRFAYCRREGEELVLESPLAPARVTLHGGAGAAAFAALARPVTPLEISATVPAIDQEAACVLVQMLQSGGIVGRADEDGSLDEDTNTPLRQWEFHDLLFHARSRQGRHGYPFGGTFRFLETLPPLPAVKPPMSTEIISLRRPDLGRLAGEDMPLTRVLETRRSLRQHGGQPVTLAQLGEFLYRAAGVRAVIDADPEQSRWYQASHRPYPSGGATYDLEVYLSVNCCDGLASGLYHYDPLGHQLEKLSSRTPAVEALLRDACRSAPLEGEPQVLITLASRFQRLSWKYQSMAYATVLKNVGVLYQTMYLVATAMGLAPCGLGGGNAELFAQAAGTDYYAETSVGEFLLGGRP